MEVRNTTCFAALAVATLLTSASGALGASVAVFDACSSSGASIDGLSGSDGTPLEGPLSSCLSSGVSGSEGPQDYDHQILGLSRTRVRFACRIASADGNGGIQYPFLSAAG